MRKLLARLRRGKGRKRKELGVGDKALKQVITGAAVPKSLSLIELEKNYVLLAKMLTGIIDRMQRMENDMEKLEKKIAQILRSKKVSRVYD